jgi:pantoate--beta-alanine ligase
MLREAGADLAWMPSVEEMYPPGFATKIAVGPLTETLEGRHRPGHFEGVATVVAKLLLQVGANAAYFGEKDYQQLLVIRRLVGDLNIPVEIVPAPTVREPDGLALSSRNLYLSEAERAQAPALIRVLRSTAEAARRRHHGPFEDLLQAAEDELRSTGFGPVDYVALCDAETLEPARSLDRPARILVAARLGRTRLIDNLAVVAGT